jgi:RNA polymerase sigma-70 factor (ECF subfamily)
MSHTSEDPSARFHRAISLSILHTAYQWGEAPRQLVDDLVQEAYLKLCADQCRQLLNFALRHPEAVTGYIKTITVNVARDYFKSIYSQKRGAGRAAESMTDVDAPSDGGSLGGVWAMEREVLFQQIDRCLSACTAGSSQDRDRMIFWFYYRQGMSAKAILAGRFLSVSRKSAIRMPRWMHRLARWKNYWNWPIKTKPPVSPTRPGLRTSARWKAKPRA